MSSQAKHDHRRYQNAGCSGCEPKCRPQLCQSSISRTRATIAPANLSETVLESPRIRGRKSASRRLKHRLASWQDYQPNRTASSSQKKRPIDEWTESGRPGTDEISCGGDVARRTTGRQYRIGWESTAAGHGGDRSADRCTERAGSRRRLWMLVAESEGALGNRRHPRRCSAQQRAHTTTAVMPAIENAVMPGDVVPNSVPIPQQLSCLQ